MEKTIREWFEELPKSHKSKAFENTREEDTLSSTEPSVHDALSGAFSWGDSPQGYDYWHKLYKTLNK